jgi:hypothetical protein
LHHERAVLAIRSPTAKTTQRRNAPLHSHHDDFHFDGALGLGLFARLNIFLKKSFATDYSFRT